jgi:hypothetical protein
MSLTLKFSSSSDAQAAYDVFFANSRGGELCSIALDYSNGTIEIGDWLAGLRLEMPDPAPMALNLVCRWQEMQLKFASVEAAETAFEDYFEGDKSAELYCSELKRRDAAIELTGWADDLDLDIPIGCIEIYI